MPRRVCAHAANLIGFLTFALCRVFGWTPKNEITNGRWVMFGFAVGLLTEYATGADFIQQLKLMVSYLGIADIYD